MNMLQVSNMILRQETKKYRSDNHMIYSYQYHITFCTKYRRYVLTDGIDKISKELILDKQSECKYEVLDIEIMPLLLDINPRIYMLGVVSQIKGYS